MGDETQPVVRRTDRYLWIVVPPGVHRVNVEGPLARHDRMGMDIPVEATVLNRSCPPAGTWLAYPRIGVPEDQVFFSLQQQREPDQAAYDQEQFDAVVRVSRQLETGLVWKIHNRVTRLSATGKAISLKLPLLEGESVLTSKTSVENGVIDVRLGAESESVSMGE